MKIKIILVIVFLIYVFQNKMFAQAPGFDWAVQAGGDSATSYAYNLAVDKSGNIIVTGVFYGTITFGDYVLHSFGTGDMFIAKYDSTGKVIWAKHAGSQDYDYGNDVAVDNNGNIYVTGVYSDSANFDSNILRSIGFQDVFLAKYSAGGQLLWIRHGGGEYDDYGYGVTTDMDGNIIITGQFQYTGIFDSQYLIGPGDYNIYVVKYDPLGNILWARSAGGNSYYNIGESVAANSKGDIFVTGSIGDTTKFDNITTASIGSSDIMIAKYDSNGNIIWVKQTGGAENYNAAYDIAIDKNDNFYITGDLRGIALFGNIEVSSNSISDIFIAKYNANGIPLWVKQESPTRNYNYAGSICSDPAGNISITGYTYPPAYGPGSQSRLNRNSPKFKESVTNITSQATTADQYLYIFKYNSDGKKMWGKSVYSASNGGIDKAPNGDLFLSGYFYDLANFDDISLTGVGYPDIFVAKIPAPQLSVAPAFIPFGYKSPTDTINYIAIGDTASKYIGIKNNSRANLHIFSTSIIAPQKDFVLDPLIHIDSISANQEAFLHIKYTAKTSLSNAYIEIVSDASTSPDTIKLRGYGAPIPLAYSVDTLSFGNVDVKDTLEKTLRISNNGNFTVKLLSENLTNKTDFISNIFNGTVPDSIKPKSSNDYKIKFNPQTPGIKSGTLIIQSNSSKYLDTIYLRGTGILRSLSFSSKQINYGNIDVGDSLVKSITITNNGTVNIIFSNKSLTNRTDFTFTDSTGTDTVHIQKSKTVNIKFNPQSPGIKTGKFIITSNSKTSPDTVNLTGTGIQRTLTFSTREINYGNIDVGDSLKKSITITNSGTVDIIFSKKSIINQTDFSLSEANIPDTISKGKSKVYNIKFNPKSSGNKNGKLIFTSNSLSSPDTVNLLGTGIIRTLTFSSKQINYGNVDVGGSLEKSLTITNSGTIDIIFSNKNFTNQTDFSFVDSVGIDTIHALKSKAVNIKFNPQSPGTKTGKFIFVSNSKTSPDTVNLSGTGIQRALTFSTRAINFGNVDVGSSLAKSITITNNGTVNIIFSNKNLTNQTDFSLSEKSIPDTITPGKSKDYHFNFTPQAQGTKAGKLIFISNAQSSPDTISLTGTGITRLLTFSSKQINYGNVDVGGWLDKSVTITNGGTVDIIISNKYLTDKNNFTLMDSSIADTIQSSKSKTYNLKFTPQSSGTKTCYFIIASNSKTSPDTVNLSGTGIQRTLTFSTREINFGNVDKGSSLVKIITITNNGTVDIIFSNKSLTNQTDFSLSEISAPDTIHSGKSKDYNIQFSPQASGEKSGKLIFISNSENSPDTVDLIGKGIIRSLSFSSKQINYGNVDVGGSLEKNITITNTGTEDIIFSKILLTDQINYSLTNITVPDTIRSDKSKNYIIRFNPKTAEIKAAALIFSSNAKSSPDTAYLTGNGINRTVTFSTREIDFGNVYVANSLEKSITITNNGSIDIIFSNKLLTNKTDFNLLDSSVPDTIHPEVSKEYSIMFSPKSVGSKNCKIIFNSNSEESVDTLVLTGFGTAAVLSLSSKQIDFGSIDINSDSVSTLKISNSGTGNLIINNYSIAGSNAGDFTLSNNTIPDTLLPKDSINLSIKFTPQTSGNKNALLLILNNSLSGSDTVQLLGKGASIISVELPVNNNIGQNTDLTINPPPGFNFNNNKLFYRRAGERTYQQSDLTASDNSYIASIPASFSTIRGIQYYVVFSEEDYTVTYPANDPINNPAFIEVKVPQYTYPSTIKKSVYRMLSIPLNISNSSIDSVLGSTYGIYDNTKWRILRWNPLTNAYAEYPKLNSDFTPGNAFWFIENDSKSFNIKNAITVSSSGSYTIKLEPGWNQIGNPYAFAIDWDSVTNSGQIQSPIHWNPDIQDYEINQKVLQPWDGYWIFNPDTGFSYLIFRPIESSGILKIKSAQIQLKDDEFLIQLKANIDKTDIVDQQNFVGMLEIAENGNDKFDVLAPPAINNNLNFNIVSGDTAYAENIVASSKDGAYWDIKLSSKFKDKNLVVELNKSSIPKDFQIWFLDKDRLLSIPIYENKLNILLPQSGNGNYRLIVGNEEFAKKHSENIPLAPLEYSLSQNYPNPFNPSTSINYQLKELSTVTMEVFNILGQKIKVLIDNQVENPGQYRVIWDGTNQTGNRVATGVYIYRIRANSFVSSKKMILMK